MSAADMFAVDRFVREQFTGKASLLLQIHDELIFEVEESVAPVFAHEVKGVMESVYALRVPLVVDVSVAMCSIIRTNQEIKKRLKN